MMDLNTVTTTTLRAGVFYRRLAEDSLRLADTVSNRALELQADNQLLRFALTQFMDATDAAALEALRRYVARNWSQRVPWVNAWR